jgi:hypothetical protein
MFEDTNSLTRSHKSGKARQYSCQKKEQRDEMSNNTLHRKLKLEQHQPH